MASQIRKQADDHRALAMAYASYIDELILRQFEKDVEERMKLSQQIISEAKESFDNQLKIQKVDIEEQIDPMERYNHERKPKPIENYWVMCVQLRWL
ncbi:galacturonosyltransferase 8-like [Citrus sinensis]|uniref:galacturonosyltransferase 8-like n=1 Tax=Citrus sinensis TaxID=2711 RepID=UPI002277593B|nr:galacturonosyltransferase 8-like [Citrus sinensis]